MREDPNSPQALWRGVNGDETLKLDYPLHNESYVVEVGGYLGDWTARMTEKYDCRITVYEPVKAFAKQLHARFLNNPKVFVVNMGVGSKNGKTDITVCDDGSNIYGQDMDMTVSPTEQVHLLDAAIVARQPIDVMSLNVEGAEFEIIPRLVETKMIENIKFLQVQFHLWYPEAQQRRREILSLLHPTHKIHYNYEFLWEAWEIR
jgi:FkbM family methyltransferase